MKIIHSLPGRLRLELPELNRDPALAALLEERLSTISGITGLRVNYKTGRALILYSPDRLTPARIKEQIGKNLSTSKTSPPAFAPPGKKAWANGGGDRAFELESLPIARQALLTGASGTLLLYTFLKAKIRPEKSGRGMGGLAKFETAFTILTGYPIFRTALEHLLKKGRLSSELLAGAAALTSLAVQESRLGLFVVWLVYLSTLLRTLAAERARDRIRILLEGKRPVARVQTRRGPVSVPAGQVAPGAAVIVRRGEKVPVDGVLLRGRGLINPCPVIGNTSPLTAAAGDAVFAGSTLLDGELLIKTERSGGETHIGRVILMLKKGDMHRPSYNARTLRLMNRISLISIILSAGVYLATGDARRAVAMLVAGTPGAAGLASSMALGTGAGVAAGRGALVKDERRLESMGRADTVLFGETALLPRHNDYDLETVAMLREAKISHIGLLTGEPGDKAGDAAGRLGLKGAWPACRPWEKVEIIRRMQKDGRTVVFVGDGESDAQALSAADAGVTMAGGSYLDLESANIVIAGSDPRQVAVLRGLARQSLKVAGQNVAASVGVNFLSEGLGALNLLSPLSLALLQNFSTFAIMFNSGRLLFPAKSGISRRRPAAEAAATAEPASRGTAAARQAAACRPAGNTAICRTNADKSYPARQRQASPRIEQGREPAWHALPPQELAACLKTDLDRGLSFTEAESRLRRCGHNTLPGRPRPSLAEILYQQLQNNMARALLGIAGVSLLLGKQGNTVMSLGVLLANTFMAALQERRTENSLQMLSGLVAPQARAIRDGREIELPARVLVPGDVIVVEAGDKIPADARLVESWRLAAEEASLTGESVPVLKQKNAAGRANMLYMGTGVLSGRARALVVSTGARTEMGRIAGIIGLNTCQRTPLHSRLDEMGIAMVRGGTAVSGLVLLAGLWHGESPGKIIVNATSLAVSFIPDGLTPIITITMALGALRMLKRRVLVRQFPAVDTLGCTQVICCDKTGTLTKNEMAVREIFCAGRQWEIDGERSLPAGRSCESTRSGGADIDSINHLLRIAYLCNNASLKRKSRSGEWLAEGDSTECALLVAAVNYGAGRNLAAGFTRLEEIPFDPEKMRMTVICRDSEGGRWSFVKGAPDMLLERCSAVRRDGRAEMLGQAERKEIFKAEREMSGRALRVLALAYKPLAGGEDTPEDGLVFAGLLGLIDPPRAGALAAIEKCRRAGVKVIMITGDHKNTALAVARETGIAAGEAEVLTGKEIDVMTDEELAKASGRIRVFARVSPRHKLRLVRALKEQGLVVAMVGDGVNDAPAIKEAHLGIAMGRSGVAVTREVAAITLADDNIEIMPEAIKEGRAVYANIRKCMRYLITTNIGDGIVILTAALMGRPIPLNPLQLLWVNLASDPLVSWALANDPPVPDIISRPPRKPGESIFGGGLGRKIATRSLCMGLGALAVYSGSLNRGESLALTRTKTMAALGLGRFFHLFDCRREKYTLAEKPGANGGVTAGATLILATLTGAMYVPFIRSILKTVPLSLTNWLPALAWSGLGTLADGGLNLLLESEEVKAGPRGKKKDINRP